MAKATTKFQIELSNNSGNAVVGFNNSNAPLKDRTDLPLLMDIAIDSGDPSLLKLFKHIPTPEQWADFRAEQFENESKE